MGQLDRKSVPVLAVCLPPVRFRLPRDTHTY